MHTHIATNQQIHKLCCWIKDSEDAFVKEKYFLSKSYIEDDYIIAPDCLGWLFLLIYLPDKNQAIELVFEEVSSINFYIEYDLDPIGEIDEQGVSFKLIDTSNSSIKASKLYVKEVEMTSGKHAYYAQFDINILESFYTY